MKKKTFLSLLILALVATALAPICTVEASGQAPYPDRFPVTLRIGTMVFDGQLRRADAITQENLNRAIEEAMRELKPKPTNPLEIREAQDLVEKVVRDDLLTPEEILDTWTNILTLTPFDKLAEAVTGLPLDEKDASTVIKIMTESEGKSPEQVASEVMDAIIEKAGDEAWDKFMETMLEKMLKESVTEDAAAQVAGDAVWWAKKVVDALTITATQYEKDQKKWRARAEAQKARELLRSYYEKLREKIEQYKGTGKGWELTIDDSYRRYFRWYDIPGNYEEWTVLMHFTREPANPSEPIGPSGSYTGYVSITVKYYTKPFDDGFLDMYQTRNAEVFNAIMRDAASAIIFSENATPTKASRQIYSCPQQDIEITLSVPAMPGKVTTTLDLSGLIDKRAFKIDHQVEHTMVRDQYTWTGDYNFRMDAGGAECVTDNWIEPDWGVAGLLACTQSYCQGGGLPWGLELPWDDAIWNIWDKPKQLTVTYPRRTTR